MNYCKIERCDVNNGPGARVTLFVSGCRNHCDGCFNPETWDFSFGEVFDETIRQTILDELGKPYIQGLTVLGGEPFEEENQPEIAGLLRMVRERYPNKNVWCFTGYRLDVDILPDNGRRHFPVTDALLRGIDVLVDGPFIKQLKCTAREYRGSTNQRFIDVKKTLASGQIVPAEV